MGNNLIERQVGIDCLISFTQKRFDFKPLSKAALVDILDRTISSDRLTRLGEEFLTDCKEQLCMRSAPNVLIAGSLEEARDCASLLLTEVPNQIGYITGGLEGLHLEIALNALTATGIATFIIGLEEDSYILSKGRRPLFSTREKVSLWEQLAPDKSVLFVIPQKPDSVSPDDYYDWITQYLGLFRSKQIIYLGSKDDPMEVILAHQRRAASPKHCLNISVGHPLLLHTTEMLVS